MNNHIKGSRKLPNNKSKSEYAEYFASVDSAVKNSGNPSGQYDTNPYMQQQMKKEFPIFDNLML